MTVGTGVGLGRIHERFTIRKVESGMTGFGIDGRCSAPASPYLEITGSEIPAPHSRVPGEPRTVNDARIESTAPRRIGIRSVPDAVLRTERIPCAISIEAASRHPPAGCQASVACFVGCNYPIRAATPPRDVRYSLRNALFALICSACTPGVTAPLGLSSGFGWPHGNGFPLGEAVAAR